ncbi:condensation domain-containing protein [Actinoplanes sp. NPDC026619]|uniref:condensation domain-containing protein n=1 Tax=Actinoplanes sp. NPDC026619 TaxID=3155798 RepID=UPI0033E7CACB
MIPSPRPSYAQERRVLAVTAEDAEGGEPAGKTIPAVCLVPERIDVAALQEAAGRLVQRHPVLRHRFTEAGGAVSLDRVGAGTVPCEVVEAGDLVAAGAGPEATAAAVDRHVRDRLDQPFDVLGWPLLRIGVVQGDSAVCYVSADHLVTDAWSQSVMTLELPVLYRAVLAGAGDPLPPAADFLSFSTAQRRRFAAGPALDAPMSALRRSLGGRPLHPPFGLDLPWDDGAGCYAGRDVLDAAGTAAVSAWCRERKSTLFMAVLAAFGTAMHEVIGVPEAGMLIATHNRDDDRIRTGIGWYANMLPLYFPVAGNLTGTLREVRRALMTTLQFHELPLARAAGELPVEQAGDDHPTCFVSFTDDRSSRRADAPALVATAGAAAPEHGWNRFLVPPARRRGYGIWISLRDDGLGFTAASPGLRGGDERLAALEDAFVEALVTMRSEPC